MRRSLASEVKEVGGCASPDAAAAVTGGELNRLKSISQTKFFSTISLYVFPANGEDPERRMYIITPTEKTSTLKSYGLSARTSGATYPGVPHRVNMYWPFGSK